jgi:uncharacterized protein (DUF924 family)
MNIITTITAEEKRVLDSWLGKDKIQEWLRQAIDNKIRQRLDATILEVTDRNPQKLTRAEKFALIKDIVLPIREERNPTETCRD